MKSRLACGMSSSTLMGLAVGLAAGVTAGLLAAPMRGNEMRASLRTRGNHARDRAMMLLGEGRRAFSRGNIDEGTPRLTATLGEIAQMHSGAEPARLEAQS